MRTAIFRRCTGEAHSNPYVDHCWMCAPFWEMFPACPDCLSVLKTPAHGQTPGRTARARCTHSACASYRRWFSVEHEPPIRDAWTWFALAWTDIAIAIFRGGADV